MKGRVYRRGNTWTYRFDIDPDPLTGRHQQAKGAVQDRAGCLESVPGRDG